MEPHGTLLATPYAPRGFWGAEPRDRSSPAPSAALRRIAVRLREAIARTPGLFIITGAATADNAAFARCLAAELGDIGATVFQGRASGHTLYGLLADVTTLLMRDGADIAASGGPPVLVRVEAELLSSHTLRDLITFFADDRVRRQGFRVVLIGHPVLRHHLAEPALAPLQAQIQLSTQLPAARAVPYRLGALALTAAALASILIGGRLHSGDPNAVFPVLKLPSSEVEIVVDSKPLEDAVRPSETASPSPDAVAILTPATPQLPPRVQTRRPAATHAPRLLRVRPPVETVPPPDADTEVASLETHSAGGASFPASAPAPQIVQDVPPAPADEPQCEPYTSTNANLHGLACRDAAGKWWIVSQHTE